jgi:hypothetical protein
MMIGCHMHALFCAGGMQLPLDILSPNPLNNLDRCAGHLYETAFVSPLLYARMNISPFEK